MHFANVDIRVKSELAELHGDRPSILQGVTVRNRGDEKGYVLTGLQSPTDTNSLGRSALQTSLPRAFAIGDARSGSTNKWHRR